jgi:RES domain-containing protein
LAALERFVNADPVTEPDDLVALSAEVPDRLHVEAIELARLPGNWRAYPPPDALQDLGDEWIRSGRSPVLAVPSAVIPTERNYLLNPLHSDFRHVRFADPDPFRFDPRMWKSSKTRR